MTRRPKLTSDEEGHHRDQPLLRVGKNKINERTVERSTSET
jgi:hypothetical protein